MSENINPERSSRDGHRSSNRAEYDLRARVEEVMKGFHGTNAIAYKNKNEYVTYSRPADSLRTGPDDEFMPDPKDFWPVLNNMRKSLPLSRIKRRPNRVDDPKWKVPHIDKPLVPAPPPEFPQSKGLKLRPIDEIIKDRELLNSLAAPLHDSRKPYQSHTAAPNPRTFEIPSSTVQGVLNNITESSRKISAYKPVAAPPIKSRSKPLTLSSATNRPRKSSLLKSEITTTPESITTPPQMGSKKPMSTLTNNPTRPRVSSKSTSVQKNKFAQDIPVNFTLGSNLLSLLID